MTATQTRPDKRSRTTRQTVLLWVLGALGLLPVLFEVPALLTLNGDTLHGSGNDVFGSGGALLLFTVLSITPLRTLTRRQWFVPLRRWYGVVFGFTILLDAIAASNDTAFNGPVGAKLAAHSFLFIGLTMTLLLVPLTIQGIWNQWSMRRLGRYWKPFQKFGTYTVWGLLGVHLLLLDGFGVQQADSPVWRVLHQRVYEWLSCSVLLLTLRLPPVRHWIQGRQKTGRSWQAWTALAPLMILFTVAYLVLVHELFYKGIGAVTLNPVDD